MRKRILSIILTICMVAAIVPAMPTTASAEGTCTCPAKCTDSYKDADCPVCKEGGTGGSCHGRNLGATIKDTDSLQNAMNVSAQYPTLYFQLVEDITLTNGHIAVPGNADAVLDLNGHTIDGSNEYGVFRVYGSLTVIDTVGTGKIINSINGAFSIQSGGYVLMKGGTIEKCTRWGAVLINGGGTFEMTGGTLKNNKYFSLFSTFDDVPNNIVFSVNATAIIRGDAQVLCCDEPDCSHFGSIYCESGTSTIYVDGGRIKGGIYNKGTIASTHEGEETLISGLIDNRGTIAAGKYTGMVTNTGSISGGTFNAEVDNQGTVSGGSFAGKATNTGSISGGTFHSEVVNQNTGTVSGGTFHSEVVNQNSGTISGGMYSETGVVKNSGTITGGIFLGTVESENGTIEDSAKVSVYFVDEAGETIKTARVLRGQGLTAADLPEIDPTQYGYAKVKYTVGNTDYRDNAEFINAVRFAEDETWVTVTLISPIKYTITCVLNNGQPDKTYNYTVTDPDFTLDNPTKEGYTFTGWGGTNLEGTSNMTVSIPKGSTGNREYTAYYWKSPVGEVTSSNYVYTVVYDTQGGSPVEPKQVWLGDISKVDVLDGVSTTRAGYRLQWWKCGSQRIMLANTTVKDLKGKADANGVITLTAVWMEKGTVTFNTAAQEYTYDGTEKAFEIKDTTPTTLDGFNVTYRQSGNTVAAPVNAGSYDVIVTREEDRTYKAVNVTIPGGLVIKPEAVTATISEISDQIYTGREIEPAITVSVGTDKIPASDYTVDYANNRNTGTATVTVTARAGGNYSFTAIQNFTINQKSITPAVTMADYVYGTDPGYPKVSGNEGGGAASVWYSTYNDIDTNTAHRQLWDVAAINGTTLNAGTYYMMAEVAQTQNYTAGTSPVITFKVMAGQCAAPAVPTLGDSTVTISEADRSKALEYSLNGGAWTDVPALDNGSFIPAGLADNTGYTLSLRVKASADGNYAASDAVSCFFVAYNANGGSGAVPGAGGSGGNPVTAASGDQLQRDGYTFAGWNTGADGTGTAYASGSVITTGATLYAQWTANRYTVTFDTVGGTEIAPKTPVKWEDKVLDGVSNPTKDGWEFAGWKCGNVTVTADTAYADLAADDTTEEITLVAQWTAHDWTDATCTAPRTCRICGKTEGTSLGHLYAHDYDDTCDHCGEKRTLEKLETIVMHRLYNSNSGEHFYTGSVTERDNLVEAGWNYEGVAWNAPVSAGDPVYRLYNPNSGDHHYTMSAEERENLVNVGWIYEGVAWNSAPQEHPGSMCLYRLYNPNADCGSHHYTGSMEERKTLEAAGWNYEGVGWFGMIY